MTPCNIKYNHLTLNKINSVLFIALSSIALLTTGCGPGFRTLENVSHEYTGQRESYCSLSASYQHLGKSDSAHTITHQQQTHAKELVRQNRLQEAIWLYRHHPEAHATVQHLTAHLEDILKHGHFKIVPKNLGGATEKHFLVFDAGISGIFKAEDHAAGLDPDAELASYRVSELLELDLVPMTVRRVVDHRPGTIQYFMGGLTSGKATHSSSINFRKLLVLDYLVSNTDRTVENFLYWTEQDRVVAIDHGQAFKVPCGHTEEIKNHLKVEKTLLAKIKNTHKSVAYDRLGDVRSGIKDYLWHKLSQLQ
jgi:hypothetical protein